VTTGEVTRATRSVTLDGVAVSEGEIIGLVNGRLCASGPQMSDVLVRILAEMSMADRELVTVYYGRDVGQSEATAVAEQIEDLYPDVEVEVLAGDQPHYFYILGAE
jgi:hypothetical protein